MLYNYTMSLDFLERTEVFQNLKNSLLAGERDLCISGIIPAAKPFLLAVLVKALARPVVFIRPVSQALFTAEEESLSFLSLLGSEARPAAFPPLGESPYLDDVPPSLDVVAARMRLLYRLRAGPVPLVITNLPAFLAPVPHPEDLPRLFMELRQGEVVGRDQILRKLAGFGYSREDLVNARGEYAWRGGVVDVFSPWEENPFRIEFSGEEVASLREFRSFTQRSLRKLERIIIPSLREFPAEEFFFPEREGTLGEKGETLDENSAPPFFPGMPAAHGPRPFVSLDHYFPEAVFFIDESEEAEEEWQRISGDFRRAFERAREKGAPVLPPEQIFPASAREHLREKAVRLVSIEPQGRKCLRLAFQSIPRFENRIPFFLEYLKKQLDERERCFLFFSRDGVRRKLAALLSQHRIPHVESSSAAGAETVGAAALLLGDFPRGFRYPPEKILFLSERDIFTEERVLVSRPRVRPHVSDLRDLKVGDYVVHTDYGIGVFKGLIKVDVGGGQRDCVAIDYREGDRLLVPTEDMNLVQKYTQVGNARPILHKLGTRVWERTKARTKKAIENLAKELLLLYAQRKAIKGYAFTAGGSWLYEFERMFEFEETEDQRRAIEDIYRDMEAESPMDRLLCGDVGYGKTEVAVRAAFKAVMDGKQVAVLCPTTVLAAQHLTTFRKRMVLFPVRVESLTRLQSRARQKKILDDLRNGLVDIVIGTHRLLSKDVAFRDLGLLIIDEEQRFGVSHKEKIKQMKARIDVLTMTATPIPRTLHLSLSGVSDISLIETPPRDRLSIHTVVAPFDPEMIAGAIQKELARGGQVYFIHNRVDGIEEMARKITAWVPQARVAVVHGQMPAVRLEKRMIDFIQQKADVLVSTTIIENGIDIPMVNTLIVNRADRFGLAQLYQLRGRVGRSSRQAVAYFLVPSYTELSPLSRERLKALQEFSALGSGFRLAAKDLEIRGAGDFLGARQHGHMEAVGFDYFMHLLEQTVRELKGEKFEEVKSSVHMRVDIRIPESYLPPANLRLNLYKRISSIESPEAMDEIRKEIEDRFGSLPPNVVRLLKVGLIKHLAQKLRIKSVDRVGGKVALAFLPRTPADLERLRELLARTSGSLTPQGVMSIPLSGKSDEEDLDETIRFLKELSGM